MVSVETENKSTTITHFEYMRYLVLVHYFLVNLLRLTEHMVAVGMICLYP